jgi:hypothetical protein
MKVVCEAHFLELTPHEGETALKKAQGSSVPKAYATQQSCTKELTFQLSRGLAKSGRVFKGYIVLEDEAAPRMTAKPKTTTIEDLFKELGIEADGEF